MFKNMVKFQPANTRHVIYCRSEFSALVSQSRDVRRPILYSLMLILDVRCLFLFSAWTSNTSCSSFWAKGLESVSMVVCCLCVAGYCRSVMLSFSSSCPVGCFMVPCKTSMRSFLSSRLRSLTCHHLQLLMFHQVMILMSVEWPANSWVW